MTTTGEDWTKRHFIILIAVYVGVVHGINAPTKISSWLPIAAYTNPEVTYTHGLGEVPIKVDVQVRIRDTTRNKDIIFNAINSGHRGEDDGSEYGGVIYVYNSNEVKMLAPGSSNGAGTGKLVHLGGSKYVGPTITGDFSSGHVRVRLWKMCEFAKPAYVSDLVTLDNTAEESYKEVFHSVGLAPDLVIVQVHLDNNWVTDAQGMSFYSQSTTSYGGVMFAFGKYSIRLWTPTKGSGSASNGVVFNAVDGWGNGGQFMYDDAASARIWAWNFGDLENDPIKLLTYSRKLPVDGTSTQSMSIIDDGFVTVTVQVDVGTNQGYRFYTAGTGPTTDNLGPSVYYGGVFYGIMDDTLMMWHPDDSETYGCLAMAYGQWGDGNEQQCIKEADSQIVIQLAYTDVDEPPCGERGCNPSDIGPTCLCAGSGYEGQYCGALVQCIPPSGHQYANYAPVQLMYDFAANVTFTCQDGYEYQQGDKQSMCDAFKAWNGDPYICTPLSCGQPEEGVHSSKTVAGLTINEVVTYVCADGYGVESGDLERTCQTNQQWSGSAPVCVLSCMDPMETPTTVERTNTGLIVGVTATFQCVIGYEYDSGDLNRLCQTDATWSGVQPVCTRVQCPAPASASGTNSDLSYNGILFEDEATYTCDAGYHIANKTLFKTTCQADKTWSPTSVCQKVLCPAFPVGVKADITSAQGIEYGNVIQYQCQVGTMLVSGALQSTCQSDTSWSGTPPVCQDIVCPDPGEVANGTIYHLDTAYQGMVIVGCDVGFAIEYGNPSRVCGDGGVWSGTKPFCGEVYQVFLNPFNGTPPYMPFLGIGGSPNNNPPITEEDIILLRVPHKSTNRYKRTLYSVPDDRWMSKFIGFTGIILVSVPFVFAIVVDTVDYVMRHSMTSSGNKVGGSGSGSGNSGNGKTGQMGSNVDKKKNPPKPKNLTDDENLCDSPADIFVSV